MKTGVRPQQRRLIVDTPALVDWAQPQPNLPEGYWRHTDSGNGKDVSHIAGVQMRLDLEAREAHQEPELQVQGRASSTRFIGVSVARRNRL